MLGKTVLAKEFECVIVEINNHVYTGITTGTQNEVKFTVDDIIAVKGAEKE